MTNSFKIREIWPDILTGRENGALAREKIKKLSNEKCNIVIDMENLTALSPSFLEEAIVKLVIEIGKENFRKKIELKNLNEATKEMLNMMLARQMPK